MVRLSRRQLRSEVLPDILKPTEAAQYARVSLATIRRWIKRYPEFPVLRDGRFGRILIYRNEFVDWLRVNKHATEEDISQ